MRGPPTALPEAHSSRHPRDTERWSPSRLSASPSCIAARGKGRSLHVRPAHSPSRPRTHPLGHARDHDNVALPRPRKWGAQWLCKGRYLTGIADLPVFLALVLAPAHYAHDVGAGGWLSERCMCDAGADAGITSRWPGRPAAGPLLALAAGYELVGRRRAKNPRSRRCCADAAGALAGRPALIAAATTVEQG